MKNEKYVTGRDESGAEGDGKTECVVCAGSERNVWVFIQGEVVYCADEKSSAIRW